MADGNEPEEFQPITSQEELDRRIGPRLERERAKFAGHDDFKAKAEKFDELESKNKTELERLQAQVAEKDGLLATAPAEARKQAIRFTSQANALGFLDPEDALVFLPADTDLSDTEAVKKALTTLAERKPHLVAKPKATPTSRPKAKKGEATGDGDGDEGLTGKARAADALRRLRA